MIKIIAQKPITDTLTIDEVLAKKDGCVVGIYNKSISFLSEYTPSEGRTAKEKAALHSLDSFEICPFSTASESKRRVLERALEIDYTGKCQNEIFYFETAKEFAEAILENGWKF